MIKTQQHSQRSFIERDPEAGDQVQIEGIITDIIFISDDKNFSIFRLLEETTDTFWTVKGSIYDPQIDLSLNITGKVVRDPRYGLQIDLLRYEIILPTTRSACLATLSSGILPGVGPATAKHMLTTFNDQPQAVYEALDKVDNSKEIFNKFCSVNGLGKKKVKAIAKSWETHRDIVGLLNFLTPHGVTPNKIIRIHKHFGAGSIRIIEDDPYNLIEVDGFGFKTVDAIAKKLGIAEDDPRRLKAVIIYTLMKNGEEQGHTYLYRNDLVNLAIDNTDLPGDILNNAIDNLLAEKTGRYNEARIVQEDGDKIYRRAMWHYEQETAKKLAELLEEDNEVTEYFKDFDFDNYFEEFEDFKREDIPEFRLADKQKEAIKTALTNRVCLLHGGAGTGKSTITQAIARALKQASFLIRQAAPTGKASQRLEEATGYTAQTIHMALLARGLSEFAHDNSNPLPVDAIIVDEFTMVNQKLAYHLTQAIGDSSSLLMIGDPNQLPPIGAGNVFSDLVKCGVIPSVKLDIVFRQKGGNYILDNSLRILNGNANMKTRDKGEDGPKDFYFLEDNDQLKIQSNIVKYVSEIIPDHLGYSQKDIIVLTPMKAANRGPLTSYNLNAALQARLNPPSRRKMQYEVKGKIPKIYRVGDRVIQTKNNYDLQVMNGDVGTIVSISKVFDEKTKKDQTLWIVEWDKGDQTEYLSGELLDNLDLAYSLTIHKCLPGDALIDTKEGYKELKDIELGDMVYTGYGYRAVTNKWDTGQKQVVKVITKSGRILRGSAEHPILICNEDNAPYYSSIQDIKIGDYACISRNKVQGGEYYKLKDPQYNSFTNTLGNCPKALDERLGQLLGIIIGDGNCNDEKDHRVEVSTPDPEIVEQVVSSYELYGLSFTHRIITKNRNIPIHGIYFHSMPFRKILEEAGLGYNTANDKVIPHAIISSPASVRIAFLRGLFDTDGSVNKKTGVIRFVTSSQVLAEQTQELLSGLGIISHLQKQRDKHYIVHIFSSETVKFRDLIGFTVKHKRDRLMNYELPKSGKTNVDNIPYLKGIGIKIRKIYHKTHPRSKGIKGMGLSQYHSRMAWLHNYSVNVNYNHLGQLFEICNIYELPIPEIAKMANSTKFYYDEIVSIEYTDDKVKMYDIEVEGHHSFVSNGFICHNSQGSEYPCVVAVTHTAHTFMLQRNLLYTMITRAKECCIVMGNKKAMFIGVNNNKVEKRQTRLCEIIKEELS